MKTRKGRLNMIEFVDEKTVRKIGVVQEKDRPHRLKVEGWVLSQARLRGVNTPRVFKYYRDSKGREILLLERIYGKHLLYRASEENANCLFNVGCQMLLLKNISIRYGWIDPPSMTGSSKKWKPFISLYAHICGDQLVRRKIIKKDYMQKLYSVIDDSNLDISVAYLVNRDIKPSNVIVDNDGKVWIVDWENAIFGDPLYDLAIFGVKYGHGILWRSLVSAYGLDVSSAKYTLYEIIGLIGIVDFYWEHRINYRGRQKQLFRLIQQFTQGSLIKNI